MSQSYNNRRGSSRSYQSSKGRGSGNTGRSNYSPRGGARRRRKPQFDITKILLGILIVLAVVIAVAAVLKFSNGSGTGDKTSTEQSSEATEPTTELTREVTVDGIAITGMSKEEARKAILEKYVWGMKVTYKDQEYQVADLMDAKISSVLEEIYSGASKDSYTIDTTGLEDAVGAEVKAMAAMWDVPAKNGTISSFDKENNKFIYAGEQTGVIIDQDKLTQDILAQLEAKNFKASITAVGKEVAPEITEAQAKEMYQVIGTYTTTTTTNKDRNKNIELAAAALNGLILQPGAEFSFNKATGERSLAKGYKPAGAYLNGELIEEPGGGVCQVSSTLYNAVVFAGLTTTERHAHSYEPSYVTPGEDAMVSYGGPDMKFVNTSSTAIAIRASFGDRQLKISIVGVPILESGVKLSMKSHKTGDLDAPAPVYEEDQTLTPGVEKVVKKETKGSRWVTNLVTSKDGVVVSDEFFHNSTYRGKSATIKRNTSGVVVTTGGAAQESTTVSDTTQAETLTPGPEESHSYAGPGEMGPGTQTQATTAAQPGPGPGQGQGPGVSETTTAAPAPAPTEPAPTAGQVSEPGAASQGGGAQDGGSQDSAPNVAPLSPGA